MTYPIHPVPTTLYNHHLVQGVAGRNDGDTPRKRERVHNYLQRSDGNYRQKHDEQVDHHNYDDDDRCTRRVQLRRMRR